jgi:hypothetical protein
LPSSLTTTSVTASEAKMASLCTRAASYSAMLTPGQSYGDQSRGQHALEHVEPSRWCSVCVVSSECAPARPGTSARHTIYVARRSPRDWRPSSRHRQPLCTSVCDAESGDGALYVELRVGAKGGPPARCGVGTCIACACLAGHTRWPRRTACVRRSNVKRGCNVNQANSLRPCPQDVSRRP